MGTINNNKNKYQIASHRGLNIVCGAAICFFKKDKIYFDENYISAGYEDSDFCYRYSIKYPEKKIIINNNCKLIHLNEEKWKKTNEWINNKNRFLEMICVK